MKKIKLFGYGYNINYTFGNFKLRLKKVKSTTNEINLCLYLKKNNCFWTNKIYFVTPKILLTKYDQQMTMLHLHQVNEENFKNIVQTIKQMQQIKTAELNLKRFEINTNFEKSEQKKDIIKQFNQLLNTQPLVVSHNDLGLNNILINQSNEQIKIIDFEFASLNIWLFDFAHILLSLELNLKYIKLLIKDLNLQKKEIENLKLCTDYICLVFQNYCQKKAKQYPKYEILKIKYEKLLTKNQHILWKEL